MTRNIKNQSVHIKYIHAYNYGIKPVKEGWWKIKCLMHNVEGDRWMTSGLRTTSSNLDNDSMSSQENLLCPQTVWDWWSVDGAWPLSSVSQCPPRACSGDCLHLCRSDGGKPSSGTRYWPQAGETQRTGVNVWWTDGQTDGQMFNVIVACLQKINSYHNSITLIVSFRIQRTRHLLNKGFLHLW